MNPIFTAARGPFVDYLTGVTGAVARVLRTGVAVPEPVLVSISESKVSITPWLPGAPLVGIVAWAEHLKDPVWSAMVHAPLTPEGRPLVSIFVDGTLDGYTAEIVGGSWRPVPDLDFSLYGQRQAIDAHRVRELAAQEEPVDLSPGPTP